MTGIVDDWTPVPRLRLTRESLVVDGEMQRPTWVVPRTVFDHRLVEAAQKAGAELVRHRVRSLSGTTLDETHTAQVVVGADGAHSVVRRSLGLRPGPMAVAIRGYAPTPADRRGQLGHRLRRRRSTDVRLVLRPRGRTLQHRLRPAPRRQAAAHSRSPDRAGRGTAARLDRGRDRLGRPPASALVLAHAHAAWTRAARR